MPWHVVADHSECPAAKPYAVVKNADGSVAGCHPSKAAANKQLAALYAQEPMMSDARPPRDNIVRAVFPGAEVRETSDGTPTLFGHLARFNEWTKIDSLFEGTFMEQVAPGSFAKTIEEGGSRARITLNHGQDPDLGDKPIAAPRVLREDDAGAYYEADLLDGVPELVVAGLRAGQYGASFRFRVTRDDFERRPKMSDYNPEGLPERTIREVELYEYGPVTYPAYQGATAAVRSLTDDYVRHLIPPAAPSVDAGAEPHLEPERRDDPDPSPLTTAPATQDPPRGGSSNSQETPVSEDKYPTREEKVARVNELRASMVAIDEAATGELDPAVQAHFDAEEKEALQLERDIRSIDERKQRLAVFGTDPRKVDGENVVPFNVIKRKSEADIYDLTEHGSFVERGQKHRDDAMRAVEIASFPNPFTDVERTRDRIASILDYSDTPDRQFARRVKATGSPLYRHAFNKIVLGQPLSPEEQRGTALAVGVDGTGGFTVPFAFDPTVIAVGVHTGAINPYRRACRVVPIVGTDTWNALTAAVVVATRTTEAAAATEQGPAFLQPQYIVTRVQAQVTYSFEMAQDRPDIAAEMATLISEAKDNEEENSMAVGTTAAANIGVLAAYGTSGAYTQMDTAGSGVLAAADALAVEAALPVRHRMNAQWFMNRKTIRAFQALETTGGQLFGGNGGYPAVGSNVVNAADGNTGLRLLGYPVNESPSAPVATTSHIIAAALINPQSYVIVERLGMTIRIISDLINSSALATGQSAIYAIWRNTAKPLNVDAGRLLDYKT